MKMLGSLAVLLNVGLCALAAPDCNLGYLPKVGPTPLRFRMMVEARTQRVPLPPLLMQDPPKPAGSDEQEINPLASQGSVLSPATNAPPAIPSVPKEVAAAPAKEAPSAPAVTGGSDEMDQSGKGPVVTPQMFLRFFNKEGTREVVVPAPAQPAVPNNKPASSTATYTSQ
jgi:hypothetical protein